MIGDAKVEWEKKTFVIIYLCLIFNFLVLFNFVSSQIFHLCHPRIKKKYLNRVQHQWRCLFVCYTIQNEMMNHLPKRYKIYVYVQMYTYISLLCTWIVNGNWHLRLPHTFSHANIMVYKQEIKRKCERKYNCEFCEILLSERYKCWCCCYVLKRLC